ncbi:glycosyltransferase [Flavobacterium sp. DG1-102-2]|uniref:glycosyltransferase n=1 Tax=Flavobacterium sp. DG1-102-2 TaxID=3081663 RepID=UPI00294A8385|nr:glycosyltransferase [Flavobacterium sp. DG1-102-2]MDV6168393.1 glycosyltransferase [Flavobacterium sp. DG1-102-2]
METKKHIAFFVTSLNVGGVERAFVNLANSFVGDGHKVDFVVCQYIGNLKSELKEEVNVISFADSRLRKSVFQLRKYIRTTTADCLITGPTYPNFIALLANLLTFNKIKVIISQHSYQDIEMNNLGILGKIAPILIRKTYNYASKVVCVSEGVSRDMVENYGVKLEKTAVIYNAVLDDQFFRKAGDIVDPHVAGHLKGKKYLVAVGRLAAVKNYPFMINTFARMRTSIPDFEYDLVILGEGEEKDNLKSLIKELSMDDSIHLLGSFANPLPVIKGAQLFIHTSYSEAMPLVYVEALALKIPVVTLINNGAEEILKGVIPKEIVHSFIESEFIDNVLKMLNIQFKDSDFPDLKNFRSEKIRNSYLEII